VTGYLPPGWSCTAYWYAGRAGMLTGDGDLEFLRCLGLRAAGLARWHRLPVWQVPEGPFTVHMWPEWVWDVTVRQMAEDGARFGDYGPGMNTGYWESAGYG
jgi:hypothetical protein